MMIFLLEWNKNIVEKGNKMLVKEEMSLKLVGKGYKNALKLFSPCKGKILKITDQNNIIKKFFS